MNRTGRIVIVASLGLALAGGGLALASRDRRAAAARHDSGGSEPFLLRQLAGKLDLTAGQKREIREVLSRHWDAGLGSSADAVRQARRELRHAIQDPAASDADVRGRAREVAGLEEALAVERHATAKEVLGILTSDQRTKARQLRDELEAAGDGIFARIDGFLGRG